jgi:tetratricopeptide (TPR) repeat protein
MNFRKFPIILAVFLLTVLIVHPVVSADTLDDILSAPNVKNVTSNHIENDAATRFYNNGVTLLDKGDYENAIKLFDQALASNTTLIRKTDAYLYTFQNKAYAQIQLGNYTDAIATVDAGLAFFPSDAMLWNNKGTALSSLGKTEDALTAFDKSISFDSNYTTAYINRGGTLIQMGRYTEAAAAYTKANETDPFNIAAADGLAVAKQREAQSFPTMTILIVIVIIAAAGVAIWYIRFRKPAEPAPEKKKAKSRKK